MNIAVRRRTIAAPVFPLAPGLRRIVTTPATWLAILAVLLYIQPATRVVQLSPDAVEYVDVARRLIAGDGYVLGIKAYHVGGSDVLHDGLAERAPLFTLLVAAILGLGFSLNVVQLVNSMLAGACVALIYGISVASFGRQTALMAGLLAATSPVMLVRMVPPMSEALAITLVLAAIWLVIDFDDRPAAKRFALAGAALGLSYLARPTGLALAAAIVVGTVVLTRDRHALLKPIVALIGTFGAFVLPTSIYSLLTRGTASYSGQTYLYSVFKDADVLRNGYGRPIPPPGQFVVENFDFVLAAVLENAGEYARLLFFDSEWLRWLLPAWPLALIALFLGRYDRRAWLVLLVAATNFAVYAATWANFQERYQLLTLLLLVPFAVDGLGRLGLARMRIPGRRFGPIHGLTAHHVAIVAIVVLWFPAFAAEYRGEFRYGDDRVRARSDRGFRWTGPPRWVEESDLSRLIEWINSRSDRHDAVAHGQPWPFTFFTGRPSTLLPTKLSPDELRALIVEYRIAFVLLDTSDRDRRGYVDDLEDLAVDGVRVTPVGRHRVFDTRPLWQRGGP